MEKEKSKNGNKKTALILVGVVDVLLLAALLLVLLMPQTSAKSVSPDLDPDFQANADSYGMESTASSMCRMPRSATAAGA